MAVQRRSYDDIEKAMRHLAFPEYSEFVESRKIVDDCLAGQKTIKEKTQYLPPNEWQQRNTDAYHGFLRRALFPGETKYAIDIYNGLFSLGDPNVSLPADKRLDYIINDASIYRDTLRRVQLRLNEEQMTHGLRCLLVEVRDNRKKPFYLTEYGANKFLRAHFVQYGGESYADFILLDESTYTYDLATFKDVPIYSLMVLALDINGNYYQRSMRLEELIGDRNTQPFDVKNPPQDGRTIYPKVAGQTFNRIPFVWCGSESLSGASFNHPPILNIAETELKLYMCMAHNSQHIYMSTQEFLFLKGVDASFKAEKITLGAGQTLAFTKPDVDAKYICTNGIGFQAEKEEIDALKSDIEKKRMSLMSAKTHQSGTVIGLIQNSQSAPLRTIVKTSGEAITQALRYMARWLGEYSEDVIDAIRYTPSERFADPRVNLSEFVALSKAVFAGEVQMLESDLYTMAKESGFINGSLTWDQFKKKYNVELEERRKIETPLPQAMGNPFTANNNKPANEPPEAEQKQV